MTEDEMDGSHHRLNGHEFAQTTGDGDGQGSLACCSPWGSKESDTTERVDNNSSVSQGERKLVEIFTKIGMAALGNRGFSPKALEKFSTS